MRRASHWFSAGCCYSLEVAWCRRAASRLGTEASGWGELPRGTVRLSETDVEGCCCSLQHGCCDLAQPGYPDSAAGAQPTFLAGAAFFFAGCLRAGAGEVGAMVCGAAVGSTRNTTGKGTRPTIGQLQECVSGKGWMPAKQRQTGPHARHTQRGRLSNCCPQNAPVPRPPLYRTTWLGGHWYTGSVYVHNAKFCREAIRRTQTGPPCPTDVPRYKQARASNCPTVRPCAP